jgi:TATA-box binding protein (TBP) (component of TFIID and TFIIIB)
MSKKQTKKKIEIITKDELEVKTESKDNKTEQELENEVKELTFPKFEDIPVSTKTFIVMTNLTIDKDKLADALPITPYVVIPKRRGRKKKNTNVDPNKNIPTGSIITIDSGTKIRGVILKKKKKKEGQNNTSFRNCVAIVMIIDGKKINFKITRNGKFQMTGCKYDKQGEDCVKYIWEYIKDKKDVYQKPESQSFKAIFIPAMRNIDFSLGFILDREKLDEYFNKHTNYYSLLETSIGYTGVNIKIPILKPITDLKLKQLAYKESENGGVWSSPKYISYQKYLDTLKPKEQQKKLEKERYNTFLVFHSGKVICSSLCEEFARDTYYLFTDLIKKNHKTFEEKLV